MMIKRKVDKFWFPWWPEKWLWGTIRIECTPAERGIWVDLLSIASKDDGHIRANEETPYPLEQLAGVLLIPIDELKSAIRKFIKLGKLVKLKTGTLYVAKWDKYQFSERHKRRIEEGKEADVRKKGHNVSKKTALKNSIIHYSKLNYNKEGPTITFAEEVEITTELKTVKGIGEKKRNEIILYLRELSIEFPDLDYVYQMKKKCAWWLDNPLTKKSNIHLQLRNWFIISQKGFDEAKKQHRVGKDYGLKKTKYPAAFLNNVYVALRKQGKNNAKYSRKIHDIDYYQAGQLAIKYKDKPAEFINFLEKK